jgi:hypothetical protein
MPEKFDTPITRAQLLQIMRDLHNTSPDLPTSDHNDLGCCIVACQNNEESLYSILTQFNTIKMSYETRQRAIKNAPKYLDEAKNLVEKLEGDQQEECRILMFDIRSGCQDDLMKTEVLCEKISALKAIISAATSESTIQAATP